MLKAFRYMPFRYLVSRLFSEVGLDTDDFTR